MDKRLYKCLHHVSNSKLTIHKDDFVANIHGVQIFGEKQKNKYNIYVMKNYIPIDKGQISDEDIVYFLLYFKRKIDNLQIETVQ